MFMSFTLNRRSVVGGIAAASLTGAGANEAPFEAPLEPNLMVQAFRRWDEEVAGARKR
jgi:hypothetical protein